MKAKKSLGQNFLLSRRIAKNIVSSSGIDEGDVIMEIGPGKGMLTRELLNTGASVIAVEKDEQLIPLLEEKFANEILNSRLKIVSGDILEVCPVVAGKYKIVANIPYYITGQIIKTFLTKDKQPSSMTVLVQKEVAERIVAKNGKESLLSISVKAYGLPKYVAKVSAKFFNPKPKVDSAILKIDKISRNFFKNLSEETFFMVVKTGFAHKRKKLKNNLSKIFQEQDIEKVLKNAQIDTNIRAEDLSLKEWKIIAKSLT